MRNQRIRHGLRISLVCVGAWISVGCGPAPIVVRDLRLQLGLEQPLVHRDVTAAPSLSGFTRQVALSQTDRIIVCRGINSPTQEISDRIVIDRVIGVLRTSVSEGEQLLRPQPQAIMLMTFVVDTPKRTVTMRYDPAT